MLLPKAVALYRARAMPIQIGNKWGPLELKRHSWRLRLCPILSLIASSGRESRAKNYRKLDNWKSADGKSDGGRLDFGARSRTRTEDPWGSSEF